MPNVGGSGVERQGWLTVVFAALEHRRLAHPEAEEPAELRSDGASVVEAVEIAEVLGDTPGCL